MPIVKINLWTGRDQSTKRKLIQSVSRSVAEVLDVDINHVQVILSEIPKENWGLQGDQASKVVPD